MLNEQGFNNDGIDASELGVSKAVIAFEFTQFAIAGFCQRLTQSEYINGWQYSDSAKLATQEIARKPSSDKDSKRRSSFALTELRVVLNSKKQ